MYIYDQGRTSGVSLGIGRLDAFGKSPKRMRVKVERTTFTPNQAQSTFYASQMDTRAAKAIRVEESVGKQAAKAAWKGVDDAYIEWSKVKYILKDDESWKIYKLAAHAAEQLGDAASRYKRLQSAISLYPPSEPPEEAAKLRSEINDLDVNWASVEIRLTRKSGKTLKLVGGPERRPERIAAIEWAREKLRNERKFTGMLPLGRYSISGQDISLEKSMASSFLYLVRIWQKRDGSFEISQPVPFQRPRDLRDEKDMPPHGSPPHTAPRKSTG